MRTTPTVLVVDDHPVVLEGIADFLESFGYHVLSALRGQEGLRLALDEQPDAVVCDYVLPDVDGLSMLRLLRQYAATAAIPFVLLTSRANDEVLQELQRFGSVAYLDKCSGVGSLLGTLEQMLAGNMPAGVV